ncbi:hypothetical protein WMY93_027764 [Mugilogobius chulae]|uniref:Uncharacterized protein n=1 Tax=Mugilogobius chulae TaxID=88201 RepID=A0AAW0MVL7_9GOBI
MASQGGLRRFKTIELNNTNSYRDRDMELNNENDLSLDREPELEMESLTGSPEDRSRGDYSSSIPPTSSSYGSGQSPTSISSMEEDSDSSPSRRQRLEEAKQQRKARHRSHGPLLPTIEDSSEEDELREEEELLREQEKMREVEQQRIRSTARKTKRDKEELRAQRRRERSKTPPSNLSPIEDASPTEELRQAAEMEELHRSSASEYSPQSLDSEAEGYETKYKTADQTGYDNEAAETETDIYEEIRQTSQNITKMQQATDEQVDLEIESAFQDKQLLDTGSAFAKLLEQSNALLTPGTSPTQMSAPVSFAETGGRIPDVRVTQHFSAKDGHKDRIKVHPGKNGITPTVAATTIAAYGVYARDAVTISQTTSSHTMTTTQSSMYGRHTGSTATSSATVSSVCSKIAEITQAYSQREVITRRVGDVRGGQVRDSSTSAAERPTEPRSPKFNLTGQVAPMMKKELMVSQTSNAPAVVSAVSPINAELYGPGPVEIRGKPSPPGMVVQMDGQDQARAVTQLIKVEEGQDAMDLRGGQIKPDSQPACCDVVYRLPFGGSCVGAPEKEGIRPPSAPPLSYESDSERQPRYHEYPMDARKAYTLPYPGRLQPSMSDTNLAEAGMQYHSKMEPQFQPPTDLGMDVTGMKPGYGSYVGMQYGSYNDLRHGGDIASQTLPIRRYNSLSNMSDYGYTARDIANFQEANLAQYSATTAREISRMCAALTQWTDMEVTQI